MPDWFDRDLSRRRARELSEKTEVGHPSGSPRALVSSPTPSPNQIADMREEMW